MKSLTQIARQRMACEFRFSHKADMATVFGDVRL
jgi:hypothetical protein